MKKFVFAPTVYEHAARVLGETPSALAADPRLLAAGHMAAYELYRHSTITVGIDIYNIEAEALGCGVSFFDDQTLPTLENTVAAEDLTGISIEGITGKGRIPLVTEAALTVKKSVSGGVNVSVPVTGPFTLAAILRGFENIVCDLHTDPDFARELITFAGEVCLETGRHYIRNGLNVAINESWIAQPLLSPGLYRDFAFDLEKRVIAGLKAAGAAGVPLISGGDTAAIAADMAQTGASLIMCDHLADRKMYKDVCARQGVILRGNINPKLVEQGRAADIEAACRQVMAALADYDGFIMGCGIVSYDTPSEHVLLFRDIAHKTWEEAWKNFEKTLDFSEIMLYNFSQVNTMGGSVEQRRRLHD